MHFPGHSSKKEESAQTALTQLNSWFPTTKNPVIISAPMYLIANGTLAAEVSKAGGIGSYSVFSLSSSNLINHFTSSNPHPKFYTTKTPKTLTKTTNKQAS